MFRTALAFVLTLAFLSSAFADQLSKTVPANRKSEVYSHAVYQKQTCISGAIPNMKVGRKPKHGKVTFQRSSFKLSKKAGGCAGKLIKGMGIYYTPDRNYRGKDTFTVNYSYETYPGSSRRHFVSTTYNITVK
ncbi:hypothetical protein [Roseibium sp.]|uniref:hypothetical protein n=1 Tax=Roseibium sp. TaxID=1936156 RepID=UPI003A96B80F